MKITFLGTGTSQGVPVIACDCQVCKSSDGRDKRLRTSLLLETCKTTISFDAGPDFRQQMLAYNVRKLDAIVISHEHKDHIGGMDDVRAFNYKTLDAINVFAEERVQKAIKREYAYVFAENSYPGVPKMRMLNLDEFPFSVGDIEIQPLRVFHFRLPIFGFRVGDMAYITDANYIPEESKEKLIGVKYLIINALRKETHISHFSLREAVEIAREVSPRRTFITHIGHQMGLHSEVSKELPPNIQLAFDGLTFDCND